MVIVCVSNGVRACPCVCAYMWRPADNLGWMSFLVCHPSLRHDHSLGWNLPSRLGCLSVSISSVWEFHVYITMPVVCVCVCTHHRIYRWEDNSQMLVLSYRMESGVQTQFVRCCMPGYPYPFSFVFLVLFHFIWGLVRQLHRWGWPCTCLRLPSAGMKGMCHRAWLFFRWDLGVHLSPLCLQGKSFTNWASPQP